MKDMEMTTVKLSKSQIESERINRHRGRVLFIDVLRLLSLVMIICYHFNAEVHRVAPMANAVFSMTILGQAIGDIGVTVFIMLSGASLMLTDRSSEGYFSFLRRRALSIFPSYWTAYLALTVVLFGLRQSLQGNGDLWKLLLTIFGLDGFLGNLITNYYYLCGEWFLGFILITYLFFPFLSGQVRKSPIWTFGGTFVVAILATYLCRHVTWLPQLHNPLVRFPDFVFGMIYMAYRLDRKWWSAVSGAIAIAIAPNLPSSLPQEISAVILGGGIIAITGSACNLVRISSNVQDTIARLGAWSFLAFLVHHWVVYLSVARFNVSGMQKPDMYFFFTLNVAVSFLAAKYLVKPADAMRRMITVIIGARA